MKIFSLIKNIAVLLLSTVLFLLVPLSGLAQLNKSKGPQPVSADCRSAIVIPIQKITTYGPTVSPAGFGEIQEIDGRRSAGKLFEKEHHTAWYILNINLDGELIFEIIPEDSLNDYDFVLFEYDSSFCDKIAAKHLMPIRSNISRNDSSNGSVTGLSCDVNQEYHGKGPGNQFSKSLLVKKGKSYMLVLDNVYDNGKGHSIRFNYIRDVVIEGIVVDGAGRPLSSEVLLSDYKGNEVMKTNTDTAGKYHLDLSLMDSMNYYLSIMNDSSFVTSLVINTIKLHNDSSHIQLKTVLPKLKKGGKYKFRNINFYGNMATLLPESFGSVQSLYKLMKKNKKMKILIEGHVNLPGAEGKEQMTTYAYDLSLERAKTVQEYLIKSGISSERIAVIGLGATRMLLPNAASEAQQSANRRVEIVVTSLYDD